MRTRTKGLIATAVGAVLLLGAEGTYAFWTDATSLDGAPLTSGHLVLDAGAIAWESVALDPDGSPVGDYAPLPSPFPPGWTLDPGTSLRGTTTMTADLVGDNLVAALSVEGAGVSGDVGPLEVAWSLDGQAAEPGALAVPGLTPADDDAAHPLTVEITYPPGATAPAGASVTVSDMTARLDQVSPSSSWRDDAPIAGVTIPLGTGSVTPPTGPIVIDRTDDLGDPVEVSTVYSYVTFDVTIDVSEIGFPLLVELSRDWGTGSGPNPEALETNGGSPAIVFPSSPPMYFSATSVTSLEVYVAGNDPSVTSTYPIEVPPGTTTLTFTLQIPVEKTYDAAEFTYDGGTVHVALRPIIDNTIQPPVAEQSADLPTLHAGPPA